MRRRRGDGGEKRTDDVDGGKVGRGAGRGPALPVEQRLGVKGEAPGECVDPAEEGGQHRQEGDHGITLALSPPGLGFWFVKLDGVGTLEGRPGVPRAQATAQTSGTVRERRTPGRSKVSRERREELGVAERG
jgi:hypothetical protein